MDLSIYETGDGGDVIFQGGDLVRTDSLFNQIYLALFGGNTKQTTREAEPQNEDNIQRFDWWGNKVLFSDKPENQFNSLTERELMQTALSSSGRSKIEATIKQDLQFMSKLADIDVSVSIVSTSRIEINILFKEPNEVEQNLTFLWDGTKLEDVENKGVFKKVVPPQPFVGFSSLWDTNNTSGGSSASNQISLPLINGGTYNFTVDWGDGNTDTITSHTDIEKLHTYSVSGIYNVKIEGVFVGFNFSIPFGGVSDLEKITDIQQWGTIQTTTANSTFSGCINLEITAQDSPDLSQTTTMNNWFQSCDSFSGTSTDMSLWDTSTITSLQNTFSNCSIFNGDVSTWNVSLVTNMFETFRDCPVFQGDVSSWDVSLVQNFTATFRGCLVFNQNISSWNVSSGQFFNSMLQACSNFNQDVGSWNMSNATEIPAMFNGCSIFNQNLNSWDVSSVTNMFALFQRCFSFNGDITSWDVSNVTNMSSMFLSCSVFNQDITGWITTSLTNMFRMFQSATIFNQDISTWNTSLVTNMSTVFLFTNSFNQDLSSWQIGLVTNMTNMFAFITLSTANYDAILVGWESQIVQNNVVFNGGNSKYTSGGAAETARANLISNSLWTITDGGAV